MLLRAHPGSPTPPSPRNPPPWRAAAQIYSVDGAGGTVLSAGLLRRLDAPLYKSCAAGLEGGRGGPATCGGGDCLLTACLWQQGFAYTDPGFELQHSRERAGMTLFNAGGGWKQVRFSLRGARCRRRHGRAAPPA